MLLILSTLIQFRKIGRRFLYHTIVSVLTLIILTGFGQLTTSQASAQTFDEQVVTLINSERQKVNITPLTTSNKLFQAASKHNTFMYDCSKTYGINSCFLHTVTQLNEATLLTRVQATGYNPQSISENIAWGYTTPAAVVGGWMNSAGHKANILGNYKDVGCSNLNALNGSYTGMYWTCDFGKSFTISPVTPTPTPTIAITPTPIQVTPTPTSQVITPTPFSKPWWCQHFRSHPLCI